MPIQPRITDEEFQDIRIIDLDLSKTTWSRVHESLRVMFLRLDREPPDTDWTRLFFEEREKRIVARRRGLWIEDNYISFDSLPDEVEKIHLADIRQSLDYANHKYRELSWQRRLKRLEEQAGQRGERDEMLALQARVRGLLGDGGAAPAAVASAAAKPAVAKPVAAVPAVAKPDASTPAAAKPVAAVPAVAKPDASTPAAAKPVAAVPAAAKPAVAAPAVATPAAAAIPPAAVAEAAPAAVASSTTMTKPKPADPADPLAEFRLRRDALKQRFRHAADPQDKEHNNGND